MAVAQLKAVLAPLGYIIVGTKRRWLARFVQCTDAQGQVERDGPCKLRRLWQACQMTPQAEQARQHTRAAQGPQRGTHPGPLKGAL